MIDPEVAYDKLKNFETADQLRQYFQDENVKGSLRSAGTCPIASWMKQTTGRSTVTVGSAIRFYATTRASECDIEFPHTDTTENFITRFDNIEYPELVRGFEN